MKLGNRIVVPILVGAAVGSSVLLVGNWQSDDIVESAAAIQTEVEASDGSRAPATSDEQPPHLIDELGSQKVADVVPAEYEVGQVVGSYSGFVPSRTVVSLCGSVARPAVINGAKTFVSIQECDFDIEFAAPYGGMTNEDLTALVLTDAKAAFVLAERLRKSKDSRPEYITTLYFHALNLSGDKRVFERLFSNENPGGNTLLRKKGALALDNTAQKYVWAKFGENLGFMGRDDVLFFEEALSAEGVAVASLSDAVETLERTMQRVADVASEGRRFE